MGLLAIYVLSPLDEAVNKSSGNMPKYRSNDLIENAALKLPMKLKFHLASVFLQRNEIPLARKLFKRAIYKDHINGFRVMVDIAGMEVLRNTLELNIDFGF